VVVSCVDVTGGGVDEDGPRAAVCCVACADAAGKTGVYEERGAWRFNVGEGVRVGNVRDGVLTSVEDD